MDGWEVLDSAIKIGFGALIAGYFSFRTLKQNQKHEIEKERRPRRIAKLEEIANECEDCIRYAENLRDEEDSVNRDIEKEMEQMISKLNKLSSHLKLMRLKEEAKLLLRFSEDFKTWINHIEAIKQREEAAKRGSLLQPEVDIIHYRRLKSLDDSTKEALNMLLEKLGKFYDK